MSEIKTTIRSVVLAAFISATPAYAHDFWIQPAAYHLPNPSSVKLSFVIGHDDEINPWNLRWDRLSSLRAIGPDGIDDLQGSLTPSEGEGAGSAAATFKAPGTYVVALESYHSYSKIDAKGFNSYIEKEGLSEIIAYRDEKRRTLRPGTELYSRRAKTIVQVGDALSDSVTKPIGQTLEIVPMVNPVNVPPGSPLPVKVLFRGAPLKGALIDITDLAKSTDAAGGVRTDAQGQASFTLEAASHYKINVIWGWPNPSNDRAEFETIFTSLVFSNDTAG
jgi:uncharacterized GH25 family protein